VPLERLAPAAARSPLSSPVPLSSPFAPLAASWLRAWPAPWPLEDSAGKRVL
jgi:hypothetical protein